LPAFLDSLKVALAVAPRVTAAVDFAKGKVNGPAFFFESVRVLDAGAVAVSGMA